MPSVGCSRSKISNPSCPIQYTLPQRDAGVVRSFNITRPTDYSSQPSHIQHPHRFPLSIGAGPLSSSRPVSDPLQPRALHSGQPRPRQILPETSQLWSHSALAFKLCANLHPFRPVCHQKCRGEGELGSPRNQSVPSVKHEASDDRDHWALCPPRWPFQPVKSLPMSRIPSNAYDGRHSESRARPAKRSVTVS